MKKINRLLRSFLESNFLGSPAPKCILVFSLFASFSGSTISGADRQGSDVLPYLETVREMEGTTGLVRYVEWLVRSDEKVSTDSQQLAASGAFQDLRRKDQELAETLLRKLQLDKESSEVLSIENLKDAISGSTHWNDLKKQIQDNGVSFSAQELADSKLDIADSGVKEALKAAIEVFEKKQGNVPAVKNLSDSRFAMSLHSGVVELEIGEESNSYPYVSFEFYNRGIFKRASPETVRAMRDAGLLKSGFASGIARSGHGTWGFDRADAIVDIDYGAAEQENGSDPEDVLKSVERLSAGLSFYAPIFVNPPIEGKSVWTKEIGFITKHRGEFFTGNVKEIDDDGNEQTIGSDFRFAHSFGLRAAVWNNDDEDYSGPDYFLDLTAFDGEDLTSDMEIEGRFRIFNSRFFGFARAHFGGENDDSISYGFYTQASWDELSSFFNAVGKKTAKD